MSGPRRSFKEFFRSLPVAYRGEIVTLVWCLGSSLPDKCPSLCLNAPPYVISPTRSSRAKSRDLHLSVGNTPAKGRFLAEFYPYRAPNDEAVGCNLDIPRIMKRISETPQGCRPAVEKTARRFDTSPPTARPSRNSFIWRPWTVLQRSGLSSAWHHLSLAVPA